MKSYFYKLAGASAFAVLGLAGAAAAQQVSSFQQSCDQIRYDARDGVGGVAARCKRADGSIVDAHLPFRSIDNTDGDLTHTGGRNAATFHATCRNMFVVQGGRAGMMLVGDCQRADGSWVGATTELWDIENKDGVLQYYWAPRPALPPVQAQAPAGIAMPQGYFRLTTMFREKEFECLEGNQRGGAMNGASFMDGCQNVSGQLWKAVPEGNGYFRLTTQFREGNGECLEGNQRGGAMNGASFMDGCQNVSGQLWKAIPENNGYFRLTTMFREGFGECLEGNQRGGAMNGASFMDGCQNVSGQLWKATSAELVATVAPTAEPRVIVQQIQSSGLANLPITFDLNSDRLTAQARGVVANLAQAIRQGGLTTARFEIQGHTDASGKADYNQDLSYRRAVSVINELVTIHGLDRSLLTAIGYGESRLLNPRQPNSGQNRRVEVHLR